ncbi:MAG TPA: M56 family metallopeptidase, partial [Rhizomicrobium sp.]
MASLTSWLSADILHALGWALIHSLWQGAGLAALAALAMAPFRRPSIRYLIAIAALAAMLAAPVATFLIAVAPGAPLHTLLPATALEIAAVPAAAPLPGAMTAHIEHIFAPATAHGLASGTLALNILPWLVAAWLCGVIVFSLRFAGGLLLLERKRRGKSQTPDAHLLALCHALQRQLGLTRAIRYLECTWLQPPGVIGWFRPVVLLPVCALTGLSQDQLRAVIAHELAHIRRHDAFVNLFQILIEALLFYHPAVWWLNRRIRLERELCCDAIAVSLTGNRVEYARALALMEEWESAPALAMAANRGPLSQRIFQILGHKPARARLRVSDVTGSFLFLAAALGAANALFGIAYPIATAQAKAAAPSQPAIAATSAPVQILPPAPIPADDRVQTIAVTAPDLSRLVRAANPARVQLAANDAPAYRPAAAAPDDQMEAMVVSGSTHEPELLNSMTMEEVPGSNTMTVTASIDGVPQKLLVGIGDLSTRVWESPAAKMKLTIRPHGRFMDAGGRYSEGVARVEDFTLASMKTGGFDVPVMPDPDFADAGFDGILGTNMMQRYDIDLDFANRKLNYFTPEETPRAGIYWSSGATQAVDMVTYSGVVYVPVTLDGHRIIALLDTSADRSFLNPQTASKEFGLEPSTLEPGNVTNGGARIKAGLHTFSSLTIGGLTIANPKIGVPFDIQSQNTGQFHAVRAFRNRYNLSEFLPPMIIGMDVLRQSHLYISFQNKRIYISPAVQGGAWEAPPAKT